MHSVIFVASPDPDKDHWIKFLSFSVAKLKQCEGVVRLSENVWLLNVRESPAALGWLIAYADQQSVAYGILPFEREPEWLPADFGPTSI